MLDFLFRRLTAEWPRAPLFDALTGEARRPHWYVEGKVPDTLGGRFAVLATLLALTMARLERDGEDGNGTSAALTERFIEVMESEHRELGMGDPTLGRTMRKLVASLARRAGLWRSAVDGERDWFETTRESLYEENVEADALDHCATELKRFWTRLENASLDDLKQGKLR